MPTPKTTTSALAAAAVAALLALPAGAQAHGVTHKTPVPERALRAMERDLLGDAHAAEHAAQRAAERASARRWSRLSPAQKARVARRNVRATASVEGPAEQLGQWGAAFDIRAFAINTVLLPTGKVLYWSFPYYPDDVDAGGFRPEEGVSYLWDPSKGQGPSAFKSVPPPVDPRTGLPAMIWCSGQSLLPDGRVLVAGGSLQQRPEPGGSWAGLQKAFVFDPWKEKWFEQAAMNDGRWYPSQVLMADGGTLIMGGYDANTDDEERINPEAEIFRPAGESGGRFERVPSADRLVELYPHLFTMPGGDVLLAGPGVNDSALLDADTRTWKDLPDAMRTRVGGTAVLRSRGVGAATEVTQIGGWEEGQPATATTETIDAAKPGEGWKADDPLQVARRYHNTVLLPDGSMVTVGGDDGSDDWTEASVANRQVELYSEETGWTLGPAESERRGYHSTAVLLPDGRVLSAGDDSAGEESAGVPGGLPGKKKDTGQLYSPPYLFADGPRPVVAGAPGAAGYGTRFGVTTPSEADVESAVLMAPGATTHAVDMNQRRVELRISGRTAGQGLELEAPADASLAPPGYYMLFLVAKSGKPSMAHWIRLGAAPAAEPQAGGNGNGNPGAPAAPEATPAPAPGVSPAAPAAPARPAAPTRPAAPGSPAAPARRAVSLALRDASARSVLRSGRVTVEARSSRPARIALRVRLAAGKRSAALRETTVVLRAAGRRTVRVALTGAAKRLLRSGARVRVTATTRGDAEARAGRTLGR